MLLTAHGTVESAVEAMKLGAVDFLQKPFAPREIRELVSRVLRRQETRKAKDHDYAYFVNAARANLRERRFDAAVELLKTAVSIEPGKPQAFNLMGVERELQGDELSALKYYRTAYWLDPTYEPVRLNIERENIGRAEPDAIQFGPND